MQGRCVCAHLHECVLFILLRWEVDLSIRAPQQQRRPVICPCRVHRGGEAAQVQLLALAASAATHGRTLGAAAAVPDVGLRQQGWWEVQAVQVFVCWLVVVRASCCVHGIAVHSFDLCFGASKTVANCHFCSCRVSRALHREMAPG